MELDGLFKKGKIIKKISKIKRVVMIVKKFGGKVFIVIVIIEVGSKVLKVYEEGGVWDVVEKVVYIVVWELVLIDFEIVEEINELMEELLNDM